MAYGLDHRIYFGIVLGEAMKQFIVIAVIWALALMAIRRMP